MSQPPFSVFLDIYGYRVAIRSSLCPVLENLAQDFAFFRTEAEPADSHTIELLEGDPPYDKISDAKAVVYTPRNVSYRSGKKLVWAAEALKAADCPEADRYLRLEYRKGWTI